MLVDESLDLGDDGLLEHPLGAFPNNQIEQAEAIELLSKGKDFGIKRFVY